MKKLQRILAAVLILTLLVPMAPQAAAAAEDNLKATVEKQVRAFADSIDQPNADDEAAWAIAGHGISKGGRKLSVTNSHVLAAALMNTELMQTAVVAGCTAMIRTMQGLSVEDLHGSGHAIWSSSEYRYGGLSAYSSYDQVYSDRLSYLCPYTSYNGSKNDYDKSMEWIAGNMVIDFHVDQTAVTEDSVTYAVELVAKDRFDFDASASGSIPGAILSLLGSFLFKEFDWQATITFSVTVPNACTHRTVHSRWIYDETAQRLVNDGTDNGLTPLTARYNGNTQNYYRLDETVILYHDRPWVLEYEVKNPGTIAFVPVDAQLLASPYLLHGNRNRLAVAQYEHLLLSESEKKQYGVDSAKQSRYHETGTPLSTLFSFSSSRLYRFRLENQVKPDGSNTIWLTVYDLTKDTLVLERIPMDDHWIKESWVDERILQSEADDRLSGVDLTINYIGSIIYNVGSGLKSVEVWVNGENGGDISYLSDNFVSASCTSGGYVEHTCTLCGAVFRDSETPATGHSFGDWKVTREPTLHEAGEKSRSCASCGHTERVELPKLDPARGDATCDGAVDGRDLILLRQSLAGWDVDADTHGADCNGDGTVNGKDLILLRQYLAGWDVELG